MSFSAQRMERDTGSRASCAGVVGGLYILIVFAFVGGCASTGTISPEEQVAKRATEWAEALLALDYDSALAMTTPGFQKSPRAARYRADFSGAGWWQDVTMKNVECDDSLPPERCEVRQIISLMRPPATSYPVPIPYDSVWLNISGEWYIFHK